MKDGLNQLTKRFDDSRTNAIFQDALLHLDYRFGIGEEFQVIPQHLDALRH